MDLYITNPLSDRRWDELVDRHPLASPFHCRGWLQALKSTYGYEPFVFTSASPGNPLKDGVVFCRICSWITGRRLVSLPFADHCEPLLTHPADLREFAYRLQVECDRQNDRYVELRPRYANDHAEFKPTRPYYLHTLDLTRSVEQLFAGLHKDSIQRKIRRAGKEGVSYDFGTSAEQVNEFYRLLLITRRRHKLFPQPRKWFNNLVACMGDRILIRLARYQGKTIAGILTLRHHSIVTYKYGCSDERFHNLGGMPVLFWKLFEESKASGVREIDFGRSDQNNPGLITFKDRLGARREPLIYCRYTRRPSRQNANIGSQILRWVVPILPDIALAAGGSALYKHIG